MRRAVVLTLTALLSLLILAGGMAWFGVELGSPAVWALDFSHIGDIARNDQGTVVLIDDFQTRALLLDERGVLRGYARAQAGAQFIAAAVGPGGEALVIERASAQQNALLRFDGVGAQTRTPLGEGAFALAGREDTVSVLSEAGGYIAVEPLYGEEAARYPAPEGGAWRASMPVGQPAYVLTYRGEIWRIEEAGPTLLMNPDKADWGEPCVPGDISVDAGGRVWIANLGSCRIGQLDGNGFSPAFSVTDVVAHGFSDVDDGGFYSVYADSAGLLSAAGDMLVWRVGGGMVGAWQRASLPLWMLAVKALLLLCAATLLALGIYLGAFALRRMFRRKIAAITGQAVQLVIFVLVFSCVIGWNVVANYRAQSEITRESWLRQSAVLGAVELGYGGLVDGDFLSVQAAQKELDAALHDISARMGGETEASLVVEKDGRVRVLAQSVRSVPLYYPLRTDMQGALTYEAALKNGQITFGEVRDESGAYLACLCPVYDRAGALAAVLDVRVSADSFMRENASFLLEMVLSAASTLVVLLFFFIEVNRLMAATVEVGPAANRRLARRPAVRWLGFLGFTAINIPMFFIPIQAAQLYHAGAPAFITLEIAEAAPLTLNMLAMAVSSTALAGWIDRNGWKPGALLGVALCAGGYMLAMLFANILWYMAMMFVAGLGAGLIALSLQAFIFATEPEGGDGGSALLSQLNSGIFAGANCGIIFGSMLSDQLGYFAAFLAAAAVFAATAWCALRLLPGARGQVEGDKASVSLPRFLFNGRVIVFLVLLLVPMTVMGFFVAHFLPIFSDQNGVSATIASWGYLLNGIAIIYLGPPLTRVLLSRLGSRRAVLFTSLAALAGIALFTVAPVMGMAFVCSLMLGISDAGGQVSRQEEFLMLPASQRAGASRALSAFSLFENIGQTVGPGIFSVILAVGVRSGMLVLALALAGCLAVYALSSARRRTAKARKGEGTTVSE